MIAVVNYGLGNVQAIINIYRQLRLEASIVTDPAELQVADRVILPGVGAFDWAMRRLRCSGLLPALEDLVLARHRPILGICVGMQMLADSSEEGSSAGLGWIPGRVRKLRPASPLRSAPLPHMGWNTIRTTRPEPLTEAMEEEARFYFLHSYCFVPQDPQDVSSVSIYGEEFAASVRRQNVLGVQFHPEKSHGWGVRLLSNFARA